MSREPRASPCASPSQPPLCIPLPHHPRLEDLGGQDIRLLAEDVRVKTGQHNLPRKPRMATVPDWWSVSTP